MVSHICLCTVQQSLEFQPIRVPVGNHVSNLTDDRREYEDADQVAHYREDVPTDQEARKRADQSKEDVISVLGSWTSGPRRSLSPFSLSFFYILPIFSSLISSFVRSFLLLYLSSLSSLSLFFSLSLYSTRSTHCSIYSHDIHTRDDDFPMICIEMYITIII